MATRELSRAASARGTVGAVRAREPDRSGYAVRSGVRLYYEVFGAGPKTVLLLPSWAIVHSRVWKLQVPYLARHFRVVTFDPRGNGLSDRPPAPSDYADAELVADALAVLDEAGVDDAVGVGLSSGGRILLQLAAAHPSRISGAVFVAPTVHLSGPRSSSGEDFEAELDSTDGWAKFNAHHWRRDYPDFLQFFLGEIFVEPHSSWQIEEGVAWGQETDAETLIATVRAPFLGDGSDRSAPSGAEIARQVRCPSLVIHGDRDHLVDIRDGMALANELGCQTEVFAGGGHSVPTRHPVRFNTVLRNFVESVPTPQAATHRTWLFARERKRRALWVCSPIGLGHVLRDLAIARSLREKVPDLEIHWLAQQPVTSVLEAHGEVVHPASVELASETAHWESESTQHDLHAFYAFRRMGETLCANYMLFDEVVRETPYDVWVGDESWEVDYFLHENPERKIAPYVFLTDVVGFLPVDPENDAREVELCADYNAEMIEHLERFPYVRDRSVFIGSFDELPNASLGTGLPRVRDWSAKWYTSVPYVVPFDPAAYRRPQKLRKKLDYGSGYPLYVAAVGGTAVGRDLLELTAEAFELVRKEQPTARMVMVTGPRLHPGEIPDVEGMDKRGYVPNLFEHLACADVAVVQGGLSTTMELVAARRPFVYFPLAHHWEQQHFVAHRLDHYGAGVRMDYAGTTPPDLAAAMLAAQRVRPTYRSIARGGADKAATQVATMLRP